MVGSDEGARPMDENERTYAVEGMTCEHCELSVQEEVEGLEGIRAAVADRARRTLTVRGVGIDDAAVRRAVGVAGYRVPT